MHAIFSYHFVLHLIFISPPYLDQALSPPGQESLHTDFGWTIKIGMTLSLTSVIMFESRNYKVRNHRLDTVKIGQIKGKGPPFAGGPEASFAGTWTWAQTWAAPATVVRKDHYNQDETFYCGPDSLGSLGSLPLGFVFHMPPVAHMPSPAISHTYKLSENKCHVIKVSGTICILIWCYGNMVFRFYELLVSNAMVILVKVVKGQEMFGSTDRIYALRKY